MTDEPDQRNPVQDVHLIEDVQRQHQGLDGHNGYSQG